jgi:hypothetical protein
MCGRFSTTTHFKPRALNRSAITIPENPAPAMRTSIFSFKMQEKCAASGDQAGKV